MKNITRILLLTLCLVAAVRATPINVASIQINDWNPAWGTSNATLRIVSNDSFFNTEGRQILRGSAANNSFYKTISCTVAGTTLNCAAFTLDSTIDSSVPGATYSAYVYDAKNVKRSDYLTDFKIPTSLGSSITWAQISTYSNTAPRPPNPGFPNTDQVNSLIQQQIQNVALPDAAINLAGKSKLSVAPANPANPIAVGDNDPRLGGGIQSYSKATLPTADTTSGTIARVTDSSRGLWRYNAATLKWTPLHEVFNVADFGAKGDAVGGIGSVSAGSKNFTAVDATFTAAFIGKTIELRGGGAGGANLITTIQSYQSPTQITLTATATTAVSGKEFVAGTDDTAAIQSAIQAAFDALGGNIFFPDGVYYHTGLFIPGVPLNPTRLLPITFSGTYQPSTFFGTLADGSERLVNRGAVLRCLSTTKPALVSNPGGAYIGFSLTVVKVQYLTFRSYQNPQQIALDFLYSSQMVVENTVVDTGTMNVLATEPTFDVSAIRTPQVNNGGLTILTNDVVSGYFNGFETNEHTNGDNINAYSCKWGLWIRGGYHAQRFGRVETGANQGTIRITNDAIAPSYFKIDQLDIEHKHSSQITPSTAWQQTTTDLSDPNNRGFGTIEYHAVTGNIGVDYTFIVTGGANTTVRRLITPGGGATKPSFFNITTDKPLPTGGTYALGFDSATLGGGNVAWGASVPSRFGFPNGGYFQININLYYAANGIGGRKISVVRATGEVLKFETKTALTNGDITPVALTITARFEAGESVDIFVSQDSGSTVAIKALSSYTPVAMTVTQVADL